MGTADLAGQAWILNVWGTWCPRCREEHPTLLAIARENRVPMMGLNWNDDRALALRWLAQLGNPYVSVAYDPVGRTAIDWGVTGAPETFLIDAERDRRQETCRSDDHGGLAARVRATLAGSRRRALMRGLALVALLLLAASAGAVDTGQRFDDPVEQARYERLIRDLRCVMCRSESIADSNVPVAADLRREVELLMRDGRSDAEIHAFLTERYGDFILLRPPVTPRTWLLWAAPALFLAGGLTVVFVVVRRRAMAARANPASLDDGPDVP